MTRRDSDQVTDVDGVRLPVGDDLELIAAVDRYVMPGRRYLELLHANFWGRPGKERDDFLADLRADAASIPHRDLAVLLSSEWRSRLTASWLIAAGMRAEFVRELGDLLLASALTYQGQGFCVALAAIGDAPSAECLRAYLERWLPEVECRYDQEWAMAALVIIDERTGSSDAQHFLVPGGLWATWARGQTDLDRRVQLLRAVLAALPA